LQSNSLDLIGFSPNNSVSKIRKMEASLLLNIFIKEEFCCWGCGLFFFWLPAASK